MARVEPISHTELADCFARLKTRLEAVVSDHNRSSDALRQFSITHSHDRSIEIANASATVRIEMVVSRGEVVVAFRPNNRHDSGIMTMHRVHRDERAWMFDDGDHPASMERFAAECVERLRRWE